MKRINKLLFIPCEILKGMGHIIPLLSLASSINKNKFDIAFIANQKYHDIIENAGYEIYNNDITGNWFFNELDIVKKFQPDLIIHDTSLVALLVSKVLNISTISVIRTGTFPKAIPSQKNKNFNFQEIFNAMDYSNVKLWGLNIDNYTDLFEGDMNIIPGICEIEKLSESLEQKDNYIYVGPLLLHDNFLSNICKKNKEDIIKHHSADNKQLEYFFLKNKDKFKVFFTSGTETQPNKELNKLINNIISRGLAVIINWESGLNQSHSDAIFSSHFLPLNYVVSNIDLMIHHCGSGTYQYPILHEKPSIVVGTGLVDIEEVGLRLNDLGIASYISINEKNFLFTIENCIMEYYHNTDGKYSNAKIKLESYSKKSKEHINNFDFEILINKLTAKEDCINLFYS